MTAVLNSSVRISRPRILRSNDPLSLPQIASVAPAVFQGSPHYSLSDRYAYIPTINILEAMLNAGYTVHEVAQARPYRTDRDPYAKHMLRLRMPKTTKRVGEVIPEVVLVNAHDGTAKYYLYCGLYRFICANGTIAGDTFHKLVVAHRIGGMSEHILGESENIVKNEFPRMIATHHQMQKITLKRRQQMRLAEEALRLRYLDGTPPFPAESLLMIRREEDEEPTLWNVFNRVQENVIEGGFGSTSFMFQRAVTVRPIHRVDQRVRINRGLWDVAMEMIK